MTRRSNVAGPCDQVLGLGLLGFGLPFAIAQPVTSIMHMRTSDAIARRRTTKVLADPDRPLPLPADDSGPLLENLMAAGGRAPHHFPCHESHRTPPLDAEVPWRFHALTAPVCRTLRERITAFDGPTATTLGLLGAADGLIVATWLPEPDEDVPNDSPDPSRLFAPTRRNMEHIAATAAAIQNMLLVATQAGVSTFWSSGGPFILRDEVLRWMGIPPEQVVLGAVYVYPSETGDAQVKPGARHGTAGPPSGWSRFVERP